MYLEYSESFQMNKVLNFKENEITYTTKINNLRIWESILLQIFTWFVYTIKLQLQFTDKGVFRMKCYIIHHHGKCYPQRQQFKRDVCTALIYTL